MVRGDLKGEGLLIPAEPAKEAGTEIFAKEERENIVLNLFSLQPERGSLEAGCAYLTDNCRRLFQVLNPLRIRASTGRDVNLVLGCHKPDFDRAWLPRLSSDDGQFKE